MKLSSDAFISIPLIAMGCIWFIEYYNDGYIKLKAGFPIYGLQAIICIVLVFTLPIILIINRMINKTDNRKKINLNNS